MYEITVLRVFAAAHAIRLPNGSLEPLHGHNWAVEVSVSAADLDDLGLVMDFHALERALDELLARVANANLNDVEPFAGGVNPTAERVAWWLGTELAPRLPSGVVLGAVRIGEAPGCTATFHPPAARARR
jgi:6-pyruvoyltetrahydropterin/6-carboxytetrahydropterin synthase